MLIWEVMYLFLLPPPSFFNPLSKYDYFFSADLASRTCSLQDEFSAIAGIREGMGVKPRGIVPLLVSS